MDLVISVFVLLDHIRVCYLICTVRVLKLGCKLLYSVCVLCALWLLIFQIVL